MKRYLILSEDGALDTPPIYVVADTKELALNRYCREIQSKEEWFKYYVQGKSIDDFLAKILFSYEDRINALEDEGLLSPSTEIIRQKVLEYFSQRLDLGNFYLKYIETDDTQILSDDIYEFISMRETSAYDVIEDSTISVLD